ncbi:hypothetical protein [Halostagnicola sp. A-GB9-2]|uniref:hypothetical protein n=1 Tax=Halostagnicola sp. A-GB9-2 TaxID=3048066 RepID=UPI0024C05F99|nr:hypothetical protein [Halostagnicola sp. A-GB9-2]MDJ1432625.1 hypothetical protein [Halostagnicola sp. A-GB9-2]
MNESILSRRCVLATIGISTLSGCSDSLPFSSDSGIRMGNMLVDNLTEDSQSIQLQLSRDGEQVYDNTVEVDANTYEIVDSSWSTEPAEYSLLYATAEELERISIPEDVEKTVTADDCNHIWVTFGGPREFNVEVTGDKGYEELTC